MKHRAAPAEQRIVARKMSRWKSVVFAKPWLKATASRNAKSTCTPGMTTRVSCNSWSSWRLRRSLSSSSLVVIRLIGGRAQPAQRLADDPRDLHLRDADALPDLGLREVLLEAQPQHLALTRRDGAEQPPERRAVLGEPEAV